MQGPKFLTAEQLLLVTLIVKIAATAALATMLVRYRRFRNILIFERRAWPDRLTFALSLGIPLTAGVVARLLLGYDALDLTMEGPFLVGLVAGPYAGATVGAMVGAPPLSWLGQLTGLDQYWNMFSPGPYRFVNREFLIITYRADPDALPALVTGTTKLLWW